MSKSAPDARALTWCRPAGGIDFETTAPLRWEIGRQGSGVWMPEVPVGFVFQASIPRPLRWLWSPLDRRYLRAACLHDYALHVLGWDRVSAAAPFAASLRSHGVDKWQALAFTMAVIAWRWSHRSSACAGLRRAGRHRDAAGPAAPRQRRRRR